MKPDRVRRVILAMMIAPFFFLFGTMILSFFKMHGGADNGPGVLALRWRSYCRFCETAKTDAPVPIPWDESWCCISRETADAGRPFSPQRRCRPWRASARRCPPPCCEQKNLADHWSFLLKSSITLRGATQIQGRKGPPLTSCGTGRVPWAFPPPLRRCPSSIPTGALSAGASLSVGW